ncbi:aminopeptidase [Desulforamulus aquiferis]|uniref:M18 family aminopeptidase n=1 Tax=Desulforamulus aquiferis TaxID=1397668 RepID=A0AAW7ZDC5_9FIRM|nr:aminopeptidase [Desulforamulus aquiferis]MDO7787273.1 aminopeptidase [Desulforamulus aquiferis]
MINQDQLRYRRKNVWEEADTKKYQDIMNFAEEYKDFISNSKSERACVRQIVARALSHGFKPLDQYQALKPGDRVIQTYREKAVLMSVVGHQGLDRGITLVGSHTDVPRLDLKPQPLYEEEKLAFLKTHYYGGIKKYQWLAVPLALHGVVCLIDGRVVEINVGDMPGDPVFAISDLLPHLAKEQMEKKLSEAVEGEQLNLLVGGIPIKQGEKERVKLAILELLYNKYGVTEEDFISAELEVVPAGTAYDIGFDRSFVGAYGQDDRVCVYNSLRAILEVGTPGRTAVALFIDKEETGSTGNTGMSGRFLQNTLADMGMLLYPNFNELSLRKILATSIALSADVTAGLDPNFEGVMEKNNAARLGGGVVVTKYTGARGKNNTNDAHAETMAFMRGLLEQNQIIWQTGELGKIDQGGGGTIAHIIAEQGFEVVDCGIALLSMHAPLEIASKADIYECYRAYKAFFAL